MDATPIPLRFGIMCRGRTLAAWQRQAVEMLLALPNVTLALLILEDAGAKGKGQPRLPLQQVLWSSYRRMLRKPAATRRVCIGDWASQVPCFTCAPQRGWSAADLHLAEQDVRAIAAYELDFVLQFAFKGVRGRILDTPRYGIWAFHHTDVSRLREAPSGFWEIYHREPVTGAALQRLTNGPERAVPLKKGYFRTKFHSYRGNIDMVYGESAYWPAALCQQLRLDAGQLKYPPAGAARAGVAEPQLPAPWQLLVFGWKMMSSNMQRVYGALFLQAEFWNIGVIEQPIQAFLQPQLLQGVAINTAPLRNRHVFYADCFGREENGQTQIYFERYDYRTGQGTIARLSYPWQPDEQPAPVFDLPYHLSYPYLYGPYCIPESSEAEQVARYDLRQQPAPPAQPLLPGVPGVDSTLFEHEGRYWMMYTRLDRDPNLNLFIAYADQPEGPWQEHAQNPVLTDVRCARPGGTPFRHEGRLYRPAQNYSRGYGSSLVINEIVELTPTTYVERPAAELTSLHPEYSAGMHTVAAIGPNRTAIDFKRHGFSPSALQHNLRRLLKRWHP
ncbi:glucosamine inositolphosphorylceramide transferase family protein [Hymenobacter psychrotolerans]|uniref:Glucosamine inositolphosphorylceramide transferase 1 N-terminal domain-containing protein n=1 Tax=Hymenobacter psychrotolerans DSM 18569 TaxID=1121959 RepID=A0A1M7DCY0_9BACT|nr:hypothetical protein [Hymenobacter psychrotolerans]SHL77278.1 hypothetical protein SAMN02746009_03343 [Hymenobacter psychrotolerans DSM 18569]